MKTVPGMLSLCVLALLPRAAATAGVVVNGRGVGEPTLKDHPIAGPGTVGPLWLDGGWEATNSLDAHNTLAATVPVSRATSLAPGPRPPGQAYL